MHSYAFFSMALILFPVGLDFANATAATTGNTGHLRDNQISSFRRRPKVGERTGHPLHRSSHMHIRIVR